MMKQTETSQSLIIEDYARCLLFYGLIGIAFSVYILWMGEILNGLILLVPTSVLVGYAKKRRFELNREQKTFVFEEKNLFGRRTMSGTWQHIQDIDIFYGRGQVHHGGGAVRVILNDGKAFRIHESGKCLLGSTDAQALRDKLQTYMGLNLSA